MVCAYLLLVFQGTQAEGQAREPAVDLVVQVPGTPNVTGQTHVLHKKRGGES